MKLVHSNLQLSSEIRNAGTVFHLRETVQIDVSQEDGLWFYESAPLGIVAYGQSQDEALRSFSEDFAVLWGEIAESPEEKLTLDAISVRHALRQAVESVEAIA